MQFTPAQQCAIDTKDCSLLVAAGAGSGKTRVLTERIIDRISSSSDDISITDFLIVTFTKAAAKEMSERIRRALTEKSVSCPHNKKIIRNLALLPQARISTISSFCLDLIKENHQKLGLSPKLRVAEDDEIDLLMARLTDKIIESRLAEPEKYGYFLTVYENFSGKKSDEPFAETIKKLYKSLTNLPDLEGFLHTVRQRYEMTESSEEIFDSFFGKLIKQYTKTDLEAARALMTDALAKCDKEPAASKLFYDVISDDIIAIDNILSSLNFGFDSTYASLCAFNPKRKPSNRNADTKELTDSVWAGVDTARNIIKDNIKDAFYTVNSQILKLCASDYKNLCTEIASIITELDNALEEQKKEKAIVSFSDVERYALKLLYDDVASMTLSETALWVSSGIKELYIDEYQDINPIEDLIFKALSAKNSDGEEFNRFMVGDSKQSIYGFRGARPAIFNGYRRSFADVTQTDKPQRKIFMQHNFRCAESVIDFTNMLFTKIMPEEYDDGDRLVFSKIEANKMTMPVKFLFCNTFEEKLSSEKCKLIQAQVIFDEIKRLVKNPECLGSKGEMYGLSDMAILTRTWSEAILLERFFSERSIPVICEKGESFFERDEIKLALSIIRSVDNPERNICTAGFMRSAAGGFTDDELAEIRRHEKKASLFSASKKYLTNQQANKGICAKLERFLEMHKKLRTLSRNSNAHEFVSSMFAITDLINICTGKAYGSVENEAAKIRKKNLLMLYDLAREFDKTAFRGISAFSEYITTKASSSDGKKSAEITGDGIRIMTIHRSKGLEFPVCFLFGLEKDAGGGFGEKITMNENVGIAFKLKSLEKVQSVNGIHGFVSTDTPFKALIKRINDDTEALEEKRLLYVALTRACDRLYLTACPKPSKDFEKRIKENRLYKITRGKNSLELILAFLYTEMPNFTVELSGEALYPGENADFAVSACVNMYTEEFIGGAEEKAQDTPVKEYKPDALLLDRIKSRIFEISRVKSSLKTIPPKLTVSLLKHGLIDYEDAEGISDAQRNPLEMPEFIRETAAKTGAEKGTAMHTFLQFCSFGHCENGGCELEGSRLLSESFITKKQYEMLDFAKLDEFFTTPLYKCIKSSKRVYRELRFNLSVPPELVMANVPENSDFVLVQGVIDCFTENADGTYSVIDFKTDNVKEDEAALVLTERYKNQLAFYCRAVEDITKNKVSRAVIFSFAGMQEIDLDVKTLLESAGLNKNEG